MKKTLVSLFVLVIAAFLIIPLFLPSSFQVERSVVIYSPRINIFSRIVDLRTWDDWSPWYAKEPDANFGFEGTPGVVGSSTSWEGQEIGSGKQVLVKVVQPEYIETRLEFTKPSQSKAVGYWKFTEVDDGTKVIWGIKGELAYPIGRYFGLFMDGEIGNDFESGLDSLKDLVETNH